MALSTSNQFTPQVQMTLGNVTFQGREIPPIFGNLGGKQEIVIFDYPGGYRDAQYMGSFPCDKSWEGELFDSSSNVQSRAAQLNLLWQSGEAINLNCGQWSYYGMVEEFEIIQQQYNYIKYRCKFKVFQDNSQSGSGGSTSSTTNLGQAQNGMNNAVNSPSNGYTFPAAITQNVGNLNNSLASNLQQAGNNVANLTPSQTQSITQQINNIQSQLAPIISGTDPVGSSAAGLVNSYLSNMANNLAPAASTQTTLNITNPNLFQLASANYGDAGLWRIIAKANNMALDPMPAGTFTNLVIPAVGDATEASTWLS